MILTFTHFFCFVFFFSISVQAIGHHVSSKKQDVIRFIFFFYVSRLPMNFGNELIGFFFFSCRTRSRPQTRHWLSFLPLVPIRWVLFHLYLDLWYRDLLCSSQWSYHTLVNNKTIISIPVFIARCSNCLIELGTKNGSYFFSAIPHTPAYLKLSPPFKSGKDFFF